MPKSGAESEVRSHRVETAKGRADPSLGPVWSQTRMEDSETENKERERERKAEVAALHYHYHPSVFAGRSKAPSTSLYPSQKEQEEGKERGSVSNLHLLISTRLMGGHSCSIERHLWSRNMKRRVCVFLGMLQPSAIQEWFSSKAG
jgi:hypothetical protein